LIREKAGQIPFEAKLSKKARSCRKMLKYRLKTTQQSQHRPKFIAHAPSNLTSGAGIEFCSCSATSATKLIISILSADKILSLTRSCQYFFQGKREFILFSDRCFTGIKTYKTKKADRLKTNPLIIS